MAGDLDFSVQLRVLNEQFNNGINQARDRFTQYAQSVQRNVAQMNTDTERASTMLAGLGNVSSDRLTAELRATADQLRNMGAGANLSGDQIEAAMQASALQVTRLGRQLEVARSEALRLSQTSASPEDIEQAAANVNRLEQELGQARSASVSLANELSGAMNRASNTADNARNAIYRMANIRVPETIRGEIDSISRALVDFQNNSGRPAAEIERATRAAEEQIRRLENELNGVDDTIRRTDTSTGGLSGGVDRLKGAFGGLQGLLAAAGLGIGVAEIIETADAFKSLEARIKLATGEGAAFVTGFEGVKQIANETFSSIESTGELFARISQAGEDLGLAQTQVLEITRTINEAIQLSGGSAASADAAITQLIQGLQSGVVRGEEFNSIMEQAPRLAKAMADGLGVTRGELRALAQDGKLTSEVVINAVQSQGEAIAGEFATLPNTVANSLQVVKNQIFNFIGEIDGALNQSSKLAEAISYIGDSLEDLDPSVVSALTGVFQNTVETVVTLGKGVKGVYDIFVDLVNTITGGSADAAEQVGLITAALHGLNIFIGFIKDGFSAIGVAAGFVVASLYGAMSDLANIAASITFGEVSDGFKRTADELQAKSKETWDSAEQDVLNWESSGAQAITNAAKTAKDRFAEIAADSEAAYRKISGDAEATAEQQEAALVKYALDNIKANDNVVSDKLRVELAEKNLQAVIDETGQATVRAMTASDIAATEAASKAEKLNAAYVSIAESLGIGLTSKYKEVKASVLELSDSFDVLTDSGYQTGEVLFAALNDMTNKAKNTDELQDIILMWEDLGKQGQLTGEDLAAGLDLANERLDALTDGVNSVNEAYKVLGLTTRAEAAKQAEAYTQAYGIIKKDGEATAGQLIDGFKKYAKAAVAANGDVVTAQLKTEAAQRGLTIAVDETGRVTFEKMGQAKAANDNVTRSVHGIRTAYDGISSSAGSAGNSMVRAANEASSAYDKLQAKIKAVKEAQAVKNGDETLRNLRQYGMEKAPVQGNQFGSKLAVENFLKSQGLSEATAIEEARKLYAKQGTRDGALNVAKLQGYKDGQVMTPADIEKFKTASMYLSEIASKARDAERQRDSRETARTATARINTQEYGRFDSQPSSSKTIDVNFKLGGASASLTMPENQENALMALLQQLQDSKAIAGY
ncbi:tape measure protein [Psychrobacter piscatorii]|uniref:Tape measure protein N-terminal domain-containing protein n=1 Tax=Psychrobacter piscatorii TaxID=554343 RepID=A0A0T6DTC6_9GAMM|nr:tape measure protein [Psychrobacter piscatorii]KRU23310.1 hypothetical protein AS194_05110 [Psychrobacter piscatorii]